MICLVDKRLLAKELLSVHKCWTQLCTKLLSTNQTINYHQNGYQIVEPFKWTPKKRVFRNDIEKPDYWQSGKVSNHYDLVKSHQQIRGIAESCQIAKTILDKVGQQLKVGITGEDIDDMVYNLCDTHGCYPSPLNYKGFPKCVTTSVNNVAVHGIPDTRPLVDGDIITVDVSIYYKGYHGDCAHTHIIGEGDDKAMLLLKVAQLCLHEAIDVCRDGQKLSAIGKTIEATASLYGFNVVPSFCGHGLGSNLHEPPQILHYNNNFNETMKENMCITIEPVITEGSPDVVIDDDDGWTVFTEDNSRTAQFEHSILITKDKAIILTLV